MSNRMSSDFVAHVVHELHRGVVGVLVRDEECGLDVAAIGVFPLAVKDLLIEVDVVVVDGVVEGYGNHLRDVSAVSIGGTDVTKAARDLGPVFAAETVGQFTDCGVAGRGAIRVGFDICQTRFPLLPLNKSLLYALLKPQKVI